MALRGRSVCRWVLIVFTVAYVAALAILAIGTFGLFGQPRDPLSAVFLLPLGLPWNLLIDRAPEVWWPWLAAMAPALNVLILWGLCVLIGRRGDQGGRPIDDLLFRARQPQRERGSPPEGEPR